MTRSLALCLALLALSGGSSSLWADDFGPWSADGRHPAMEQGQTQHRTPRQGPGLLATSPFSLAGLLWSHLLTRIDGPRCAHKPSCSIYAQQAMARHGLPKGAWLALNRLMRGAHSSVLRRLPMVRGASGIFFLDPLPD